MDLKQSRSTMEIVVAIGAKTTCCNQSPPSQKNSSERRDFRCCTITCFNCFSCLVFVQRLGVSWMCPKRSCSLPPKKCFKLLMSKKSSNFGKLQFISSKTSPRALGATRKPRGFFSVVRQRTTQGLCWKFTWTSIALLHLYVEVRGRLCGEKLCDVTWLYGWTNDMWWWYSVKSCW